MKKKALMTLILLMLSGCKHLDVIKFVTPGSCAAGTPQQEASLTPEASYNNMVACLKANEKRFALNHFAVAGTTTWYDAVVRPVEKNIVRHKDLMKKALSGLSKSEQNDAWESFSQMLRNKQSLAEVCRYMEQIAEVRRQTQVFDDIAWNSAVKGYLHCQSNRVTHFS